MFDEFKCSCASRDDFISLFQHVAECFAPTYFHDRNNPPVVIIEGDMAAGKSLVVETMIKTWSDDYTLSDVYAKERTYMFMEASPSQAARQTVSGTFNIHGKKTTMYFNSDGVLWSPENNPKEEIKRSQDVEGGAIFVSDVGRFDEDLSEERWLSVYVRLNSQRILKTNNLWHRDLSIKISSDRIMSDSHFQRQWQGVLDSAPR